MDAQPPSTRCATASRQTALVLCAAALSGLGVLLFVARFVLNEPHFIGAHEDWRHQPGAILAVVAGPFCFLVACFLCLLALVKGRDGFAWAALLVALTGFGIILALAWLGCGAFGSTGRSFQP